MFHKNIPFVGKFTETIITDKLQYIVLIGISLMVFVLVGVLYFANSPVFQRFIGKINPLIAFVLVIVLGFFLLSFLLSQKWFAIYERENLKALLQSSGLAALLGIIMILADAI